MEHELRVIFEKANAMFLRENMDLLKRRVAERTLCGALMLALYKVIQETEYAGYYVDVEYNRNIAKKDLQKTIFDEGGKIRKINCDLIVHSRGNAPLDNLIAIEMKKHDRTKKSKDDDKERLRCLTRSLKTVVRDENGDPINVCGYQLGIYYEINLNKETVYLEYYQEGDKFWDGNSTYTELINASVEKQE